MLRRLIGADVELVTLPAEQACFVSVDPTELDQALLNLAVNARDAMPSGGRLTISTGIATARGLVVCVPARRRHRLRHRPGR